MALAWNRLEPPTCRALALEVPQHPRATAWRRRAWRRRACRNGLLQQSNYGIYSLACCVTSAILCLSWPPPGFLPEFDLLLVSCLLGGLKRLSGLQALEPPIHIFHSVKAALDFIHQPACPTPQLPRAQRLASLCHVALAASDSRVSFNLGNFKSQHSHQTRGACYLGSATTHCVHEFGDTFASILGP